MATLFCRCEKEMDCPLEVVIWNYFDHEHVVGTHYKWYSSARVIGEKDGWCLVERSYKLPVVNLKSTSVGFMYLETPNHIVSYQFGKLGSQMRQDIYLTEQGPDRCLVVSEYRMEVFGVFKIFEPIYRKTITRWFINTWDEDAPMRLRRWKVWKLGFRNFIGIEYINKKTAQPTQIDTRPYPIELPVPKSTPITAAEGFSRPFDKSVEVGY